MDPRHESYKEALFNHLIVIINDYIQNNTDVLINDTALRNKIIMICTHIYQTLGLHVDISGIFSKHNLLSIDVVSLPLIHDAESIKYLTESEFNQISEEAHQLEDELTNIHIPK